MHCHSSAHWNLTGVLPGNSNRVTGRKIITGKRPFLTGVIAQPGLSTATGYPCPNRTNMLKSSTQSNRGELVTGTAEFEPDRIDFLSPSLAPMVGLPVRNEKCRRHKVVRTEILCAECTDREIHSSDGDHFRDHFCVYVSGHKI